MKKVIVYAWSVFFVARIFLYIIGIAGDIYLINQDLYLAIDYILIVLTVAFAIILLQKIGVGKRKSMIVSIIFGSFFFVIITFYTIFGNLLSGYTSSYFFKSPSGKHILLIDEKPNITGCVIRGYEVLFNIFKKGSGYKSVSFAEPDKPFAKGNYVIEWTNDNSVKVTVYSDGTEKSFDLIFN